MPPPAAPSDEGVVARLKPKYRGVSHQIAFFVALATGIVVAIDAPAAAWPEIGVYLLAIPMLFGFSAMLHRGTWSPVALKRMRRLDHSMIFVAIAASYTAVAGLALGGATRTAVLVVAWVGAGLGVTTKLLWFDAPRWIGATAYILIGWMAVAVLPQLTTALGWVGFTLLLTGGVLYTVGAIIFARNRPDPLPDVFGFHEVWHVLVIAGATAHYVLVVFVVLPAV